MDLDEYAYLEKAVAPLKPFNDSRDAEYKAKRKGDEDSSERGRERDRKKESKKLPHDKLHDRDRHEHDSRWRRRRAKCWSVGDREQERVDGWLNGDGCGRGGRERFRDLENSRGRARGTDDEHFDKQVEYDDWWLDGDEELGGSRHPRERKKKKEAAASAEVEVDPDRDQRTVFAYQISLKADESDIYDFFSKAGKVRDVRLIMDRNLKRSKGMGYVEFYDAMSVPMAIAMTGQLLLKQPVMVKPSEAEKNLVQSTAGATGAGGTMGPYNGGARRLYVGNLHYDITKEQLRQVFESFGRVEFVQLSMDSGTLQSKGYAFIQFARHEDAQCAQTSLNGVFDLAGRVIKVLMVMEQRNMQEPGSVAGELDGDDSGSLCLTSCSRMRLMQKLDCGGTVTSVTGSNSVLPSPPPLVLLPGAPPVATNSAPLVLGSVVQPGMTGMVGPSNTGSAASIGTPSQCLLLQNMFDPSTETDADFDLDIKDEVRSECSKFGAVKHIYVNKTSAGHVYLRMDQLSAASSAQRALHGRWFAGRTIAVTFLTVDEYETKVPDDTRDGSPCIGFLRSVDAPFQA